MSTRATAAIAGATSATNTAARAKSAIDAVIARQQTALDGVRAAETVQIGRAAGLPGCRAAHHLAAFGEPFGQDGRQTTRAGSWRPGLHAPDGAELQLRQRRGELLQRPAAMKCTMRPLCRSGPEPASR
jgi:hypothetical protein